MSRRVRAHRAHGGAHRPVEGNGGRAVAGEARGVQAAGQAVPARSRPDAAAQLRRGRSNAGSRPSDCDVVVSPGSIPLSYVRTDKPMAFWTDVSFATMAEYYPEFSNLSARTLARGQRRGAGGARRRARVAVYSLGVGREGGDQQLRRRSREGPRRAAAARTSTMHPTRAEVEQMLAARSREVHAALPRGATGSARGAARRSR